MSSPTATQKSPDGGESTSKAVSMVPDGVKEKNEEAEETPEDKPVEAELVKDTLKSISAGILKEEAEDAAAANSPSTGMDKAASPGNRSPEEVKQALTSISKQVLEEDTELERADAQEGGDKVPETLEEVARSLHDENASSCDSDNQTNAEFIDERLPLSERDNSKLLKAAFDGDIAEAHELLKDDPSLSGSDRHGWTALHWAVSRGQYAFTKMLLERKCNVNQQESINGWAPLHIAAINQRIKIASLLLEYGASSSLRDRYVFSSSQTWHTLVLECFQEVCQVRTTALLGGMTCQLTA